MSDPVAENPVLDEDDMPRRPDFVEPVKPMGDELERRMDEIEDQDLTGEGRQQPRPYALPGEDEGPLGEGGQLRGPDAGGGGSS
ncbi:MAG: hypothetical protein AB1673_03495 [Actinomycetota bacterium]